MYTDFCNRLKSLREERELSQNKFALAIGQTQQNISKWEKGVIEPDLKNLVKIAIFFNVTVDYLLGLSNSDVKSWIKEEKEII